MGPKNVLGFGKFSRKLHATLNPGLGKLTDKGLRKLGMNPNDPLNLAKEKQMKNAEKAKKTAEQLAEETRARQATDLANLDDEENRRIKKLLSGSRGTRNYRGGPMFRGRATNTSGGSARSAAGGTSSSANAGAYRSGGRAGGLSRTGARSLIAQP